VRRGRSATIMVALLLALGPSAAGAGIITSPLVDTVTPNNDDVGGANPNLVELFGALFTVGPSDSPFTVANSGGVTEYRIAMFVTNATAKSWSAFRLELGTGVGDAFVPIAALSALDFDMPDDSPGPTGGLFASVEKQASALRFSQGVVPDEVFNAFIFSIDVPDTDDPSGVSAFTLRRVPEVAVAIPLPGALVLVGSSLLGLAGLSFRHTCRRIR